MRIVLPGALPEPRQARELTAWLHKTAPCLVAWLERSRATRMVADPVHTYCTAYEYWKLLQHGFEPHADQRISAGLGPTLTDTTATDDPVWLVELVHISPSRDGAVLIPAKELDITPEQSVALFESAKALFDDSVFELHACGTMHWRITPPPDYVPECASPELVSISTVNDWWRQDEAGRPWRRLSNELQMLWFDHPVNQARQELGQVPINSVWLFGGAKPSQLGVPGNAALEGTQVHTNLLAPFRSQDWGAWLEALARLESELFSPTRDQPEIVMIGDDRLVTLTPDRRLWARLLPGTKDTWKKWWSPQN